jgi:peptidoglycan/LPS O-acetylase OafA/YrhL
MYESYGHPIMHEWPIRHLGYAISATMILYGVATLDRAGRARVPATALRMGAASYSIYLIHIPALSVIEFGLRPIRSMIPIPSELVAIVAISMTIVIGVKFSEAIEQPLLGFGRRAYARVTAEVVRAAV